MTGHQGWERDVRAAQASSLARWTDILYLVSSYILELRLRREGGREGGAWGRPARGESVIHW